MPEQDLSPMVQQLLWSRASFVKFSDKFGEQAQQALLYANDEAARLNHNYIGTERLLLGLLREERGIAAKVLNEAGITLENVRMVIEHVVGRGEPLAPDTERGLTPRAQVVLALAISEGWRAPDHRTETGHLLLGLIREGEGLAVRAIVSLGVPLEQLRIKVLQALVGQEISTEALREAGRTKSNVVACRIDGQDLDAIDALVEVGVRSTRSDAASWLIHAGIEANKAVLDSVYATVMEIRQLRNKAQSAVQELLKKGTDQEQEKQG
jgi:ATP-dependent Clp protease ATP-binding subunit ClpA